MACKEWNERARRRLRASPACPTTTPGSSAPSTWRHVAFIEQPPTPPTSGCRMGRRARGRRRRFDGVRWLMSSDVCKHCTHAGVPGRLPDRRAVPHRVRHRRRAAGHLQRLRLLRARLPVRRDRPAQGRRPGLQVHALLRPAQDDLEPACAKACPTESIQFGDARRAARAGRRAGRATLHERGRRRRPALRRTTRTTASAATARSSCCSTSRRSTGCRPTRSSPPATSPAMWQHVGGGRGRAGRPRRRGRSLGRQAMSAARRGARWCPSAEFAVLLRPAGHQGAGVEAAEIPLYLFLGGLAGASSRRSPRVRAPPDRPALARRAAGVAAAGGDRPAPSLLIHDLGRPERFLQHAAGVQADLAADRRLLDPGAVSARSPRPRRPSRRSPVGCRALGAAGRRRRCRARPAAGDLHRGAASPTPPCPAWHEAHRELPFVFAGSAAAAAGGLGLLAAPSPSRARPGAGTAGCGRRAGDVRADEKRLGMVAEPYRGPRRAAAARRGGALARRAAGAVLGRRNRGVRGVRRGPAGGVRLHPVRHLPRRRGLGPRPALHDRAAARAAEARCSRRDHRSPG